MRSIIKNGNKTKVMNEKTKFICFSLVIMFCGLFTNGCTSEKKVNQEKTPSSTAELTTTEAIIEKSTDTESISVSEETIEENYELDAIQKLFVSLNSSITREDIDKYISDNGLVKYAFTHDSAYYIGYDDSAVRKRGQDREGEAIDINFVTSGDLEKIGKVSSAEYAIHTGFDTITLLKYKDEKFYYNGEICVDGNESMDRYMKNSDSAEK